MSAPEIRRNISQCKDNTFFLKFVWSKSYKMKILCCLFLTKCICPSARPENSALEEGWDVSKMREKTVRFKCGRHEVVVRW